MNRMEHFFYMFTKKAVQGDAKNISMIMNAAALSPLVGPIVTALFTCSHKHLDSTVTKVVCAHK